MRNFDLRDSGRSRVSRRGRLRKKVAVPDKSIVLFEKEGLVPASSAISAAGGLTLTVQPTPIVERLDNQGRVLWRFDEKRQIGIDINLKAVVAQADDGVSFVPIEIRCPVNTMSNILLTYF